MNNIKSIALIISGLATFLAIWMFAREYFFIAIFGFSMLGLLLENARLHKKLRELGHPQDLKSRAQAIAKEKA